MAGAGGTTVRVALMRCWAHSADSAQVWVELGGREGPDGALLRVVEVASGAQLRAMDPPPDVIVLSNPAGMYKTLDAGDRDLVLEVLERSTRRRGGARAGLIATYCTFSNGGTDNTCLMPLFGLRSRPLSHTAMTPCTYTAAGPLGLHLFGGDERFASTGYPVAQVPIAMAEDPAGAPRQSPDLTWVPWADPSGRVLPSLVDPLSKGAVSAVATGGAEAPGLALLYYKCPTHHAFYFSSMVDYKPLARDRDVIAQCVFFLAASQKLRSVAQVLATAYNSGHECPLAMVPQDIMSQIVSNVY
eukprot:m51a1_g9859 hypothetical protein (301) ;mRNA; r:1988888-1989852